MKSTGRRDPVAAAATAPAVVEVLNEGLDTLNEREAGVITMHFGLHDGRPWDWHEIALVYGVSEYRVRDILRVGMLKLRHPSRMHGKGFADFLGEDLPPAVLDRLRRRANGAPIEDTTLVQCARHGWIVLEETLWAWAQDGSGETASVTRELRRRCRMCPCALPISTTRPSIYCEPACRQAGHRFDKRPGRTPALTDAQVEVSKKLLGASIPAAMLAQSMNVSLTTLRRYMKEAGLDSLEPQTLRELLNSPTREKAAGNRRP